MLSAEVTQTSSRSNWSVRTRPQHKNIPVCGENLHTATSPKLAVPSPIAIERDVVIKDGLTYRQPAFAGMFSIYNRAVRESRKRQVITAVRGRTGLREADRLFERHMDKVLLRTTRAPASSNPGQIRPNPALAASNRGPRGVRR